MTQSCNHESELRITLKPWGIEKEFVCKKCGSKKICSDYIVPMAYTGHGIRSKFRHYKPSEDENETKEKKHWWQ